MYAYRWSTRLRNAVRPLALVLIPALAAANPPSGAPLDLYLEVYLNGVSSRQILHVQQFGERILGSRQGLSQLGISAAPDAAPAGPFVALDEIPTLYYRVLAEQQILDLNIEADRLQPPPAASRPSAAPDAWTTPGAVLNYELFARQQMGGGDDRNNLSGLLELRGFGAAGAFSQTSLYNDELPQPLVRLDSHWQYSAPGRLLTLRLGDTVSASLPWIRPVRFAGVQLRRNFELQPDLVTFPLPAARGVTPVPSSVDIYIDNVRRYSREVPAGPFSIDELPVATGRGQMRLVVNDALGRETVIDIPFYADAQLLRPGLADFALEIGWLRENYGLRSDDYRPQPAFSGVARVGLTPSLTLETAAQGHDGLHGAGLGIVAAAGGWGTLSAALAASDTATGTGRLASLAYRLQAGRFAVFGTTRQADDAYRDLASVSAAPPPRRFDQFSLSVSPPGVGSFSLSFIDIRDGRGSGSPDNVTVCPPGPGCLLPFPARIRLATASYSRQLSRRIHLMATAFRNLDVEDETGASLSFSWAMGRQVHAGLSARASRDARFATARAAKPVPVDQPGAGWQLEFAEGDLQVRQANAGYLGRYGRVDARIFSLGEVEQASLGMRGAVVAIDRGLFLADRIHDSFAIVNAGAPDVAVLRENRNVGQTGRGGRLLVNHLYAYQRNRIALDTTTLPPQYAVEHDQVVASPEHLAGVVLDFEGRTISAARIILTLPSGAPVPLGAEVIGARGDPGIVGYGGLAYLDRLERENLVLVRWAEGACRAQFEVDPAALGERPLGPVTCL